MIQIRRLILGDLLATAGGAVGALCLVFAFGTLQMLERSGDQRSRDLVASLGADLRHGFKQPQLLGLAARDWWSAGLIDLNRPEQVEALLLPMAERNDLVGGIFLHTPQGKGLLLTRTSASGQGTRGPWVTFLFERREGRLLQRRYREAGVTLANSSWEPAFLDPATRPWYTQGLKAYRPHWVEPYPFIGGDSQGLSYVVPFRAGDGTLQGILNVDAYLEELTGRAWESRLGPGRLLLTDGDGRALVLPRVPELGTLSQRSQAFLRRIGPEFLSAFRALDVAWKGRSGQDASVSFRHEGTRYHGFVEQAGYIEDTTWTLRYLVPTAELLAPARTPLLLMALLGTACLAVVAYRTFRLSQRVGRPLHTLEQAAEVLRGGGVPELLNTGIHEFRALGEVLHQAGQERVAAEDRQRQSEHRQRLETVGTLAGGIAHDVNNQLMAILGQLDLVRAQLPSTHPVSRRLDRSEEAARRCAQMIRSLLAFTHNAKPELRPVDLNQLVEETANLIGRVLGGLVDLQLDLEANLPLVVAEPIELEQVLMNLAVNARDAMPDGGTLRIATRRGPGGKLIVEVEDTGLGIPEEVIPHIFEPFYTTKEVGKGTGLGLSMVHGIIKAHQGSITVSSSLGRGTQFRIQLPGRPDLNTSERLQALKPREDVDFAGLRILLVDDEPLVRETMGELLTLHGADVTTAVDGEEAFTTWQQGRFDLLVTDQRMPRCTGLQLLERIRQEGSSLPVLIVSGYGLEGVQETQERDPRLRILGKPFDTPQFLAAIGELARLG